MKRRLFVAMSVLFSGIMATGVLAGSMVPARQTLEELGYEASWDAEEKTAVFKNDVNTVKVKSGEGFFEVNGKVVLFDGAEYNGKTYNAPVLIDGSFYLPEDELLDAIGAADETESASETKPESVNEVSLDKQKLSDIEGISNARQFGGYVNKEGKTFKQNVLIRTGAPGMGTEGDLKLLSEKYKVSDIVDLRMDQETQSVPEPEVEGATNHHIAMNISGKLANLMTEENMKAYAEARATGDKGKLLMVLSESGVLPTPTMYEYFLSDEAIAGFKEFFNILLNKPEGSSVLFHCSQGKDRTGMAAALVLYALDFDDETIMADYMLTNEANAAIIAADEKAISAYTDDPAVIERAKLVDAVSEELLSSTVEKMTEKYGSVKGYLHDAVGLSDADIAQLKDMYLK